LKEFSEDIVVESSLDRFVVQEMNLHIDVKDFASYLSAKGLPLPRLSGRKAVLIPDIPEGNVRKPKGTFYQLLLATGVRHYAMELPETIPICPKEFPPYRDIFHAQLFSDLASRIVAEILRFSLLYEVDLLITESEETAWVINKFQDAGSKVEVTTLLALACL